MTITKQNCGEKIPLHIDLNFTEMHMHGSTNHVEMALR